MLTPTVDFGRCSLCLGCIEIAPKVFHVNEAGGYVEVLSLTTYPVDTVDEAIAMCPEDCIAWEDSRTG